MDGGKAHHRSGTAAALPQAVCTLGTAPHRLPVLGHALALRNSPLEFLASLPKHGDLVAIGLGPSTAYVTCDPELSHLVLRDSTAFDKGGPLIEQAAKILGDGLATCPRQAHRRQRRLIQPAFVAERIAEYAQAMPSSIAAVMGSWRDGQVIDALQAMTDIASRVTAHTIFSAVPERTMDEFGECITITFDGFYKQMTSPLPFLKRLPTPANKRYMQARSRMDQIVSDTITQYRNSKNAPHGDLLSMLLAAHDGQGDTLSEQEVHDQVITFFIGGIETAASLLAWALHLLGRHPHIRQRLHSEVDEVLDGNPASWDDIPRLGLTTRILTETMRLYPPGPLFTRVTTAETELGGHTFPAGTDIVYSAYIVHHLPEIYPSPHLFDPDRWLPGTPPPPRGAYIPFGGGARKCIGDSFAMAEATLALSTIAARFDLEPDPRVLVKPMVRTTLRPDLLPMRLHARTPRRP